MRPVDDDAANGDGIERRTVISLCVGDLRT
jgi:hypothetical protein